GHFGILALILLFKRRLLRLPFRQRFAQAQPLLLLALFLVLLVLALHFRLLFRRERLVVEPAVGHRAAALGAFGVGGVADAVGRLVPVVALDALPERVGEMDVEAEAASAAGRAGAGPHFFVGHPAHLDGLEAHAFRAMQAGALLVEHLGVGLEGIVVRL